MKVDGAVGGLLGVGYEGRALPEFIDELRAEGVRRLVDVRLTPISRKRGFSKTALSSALADAGITYEHRPELGNPKPNRAGFAGGDGEVEQARSVFRARMAEPAAIDALESLARSAVQERVAVLCFEADQSRCHRDVVLAAVAVRAVTILGSRRPAR